MLKRYRESLGAFEQALNIDLGDATAWRGKGIALAALRKYEESLEALNIAISLNPEDALAWDSKGSVLNKLGVPDDVVRRQSGISDANREE